MADTPTPYRIEQAVAAWQAARARLLADDADLAGDEAALTAILGAETGDIHDILARLLRGARHAATMAESAAEQAAAMKGREGRYKRRAEQMRATAFAIMDAVGERKIELPDLTATIAAGRPSVVITDETLIPEDYQRVRREPDKAAIIDAMKQGVVVPGVEWSNSLPSLQLRSK